MLYVGIHLRRGQGSYLFSRDGFLSLNSGGITVGYARLPAIGNLKPSFSTTKKALYIV